ncbi:MAG TPA: beta-ketoacyl-ACP synthase II [Anaerolineae bacterium]|nr:beta-ketoacyl-ACP synthase II [Anaerolineae bacterium]
MAQNGTRVVITGMGTVNCTGLTVEESWANVVAGRSGIAPLTLFDHSACSVHIGGEVKQFDPANYMDFKEARRRDRFCQLGVAAAKQALDQSGLTITEDVADNVGVIFGTGTGGLESYTQFVQGYYREGAKRIHPFAIPMVICDSPAAAMAIDWNLRGPNFAPVSACAAAADAIGLACQSIKLQQAKAFIAGGSEGSIHLAGILAFDRLGAMSRNNADPAGACKPFDKNRDGIVMGEGAAAVMVEELEFAQAHGAKVLAEVIGYAATSDAFHVIAPAENGVGARRAMQRALQDAGVQPAAIDWISAHGTGTQLNDKFETMAIKDVFGEQAYNIPITSTKPLTGHMMGATGALEVIFGIKALETGLIPPTINYQTPDPDCDLDYVPNVARERRIDTFMSNAFGFGGHNAVLVLKRFTE